MASDSIFKTYTKCDVGSEDCRELKGEILRILTFIDIALIGDTRRSGQPRSLLTSTGV